MVLHYRTSNSTKVSNSIFKFTNSNTAKKNLIISTSNIRSYQAPGFKANSEPEPYFCTYTMSARVWRNWPCNSPWPAKGVHVTVRWGWWTRSDYRGFYVIKSQRRHFPYPPYFHHYLLRHRSELIVCPNIIEQSFTRNDSTQTRAKQKCSGHFTMKGVFLFRGRDKRRRSIPGMRLCILDVVSWVPESKAPDELNGSPKIMTAASACAVIITWKTSVNRGTSWFAVRHFRSVSSWFC